jgi:pimeloyl-ACP methyl ester carboxylesterase
MEDSEMTKSIFKSQQGKNLILNQYENYLLLFDTEIEREYVETKFGKTHILKLGNKNGKPLFIFQGGNCINPMTLSWFKKLLDDYYIYAPDTIGHPGYSAETRISASDESFAIWISDIMNHYKIEKSAFIGPSYGGGIILRMATYIPDKIICAVLVSPSGISLGSKTEMIIKVLVPMILYKMTKNDQYLYKLTDEMSNKEMKEMDRKIIGNIFNFTRLEQDMPKLTTKEELIKYNSPTLIITGENDVFFPEGKIAKKAKEIFAKNMEYKSYKMGHFPNEKNIEEINIKILKFLDKHYPPMNKILNK